MRRIILIFIIAFILNLIWENTHFVLYDNYMGGEISRLILFRASVSDAIYISIIGALVLYFPYLHKNIWVACLMLVSISIFIEIWALGTGRWAYNALMPIIPFLSVGLTPSIQLGLLGYVSFKMEEYISSRYFHELGR